ncbi:unnamed protein product [Ranitomeya imitator]|uniref:Uncharacterized protein n=1 Tax=Ranitomeya imitator TaxID=111125 RepID=A0ABN9LTD7_9NEOB|nr:unnamed protein product [Ranitomeya imitator]
MEHGDEKGIDHTQENVIDCCKRGLVESDTRKENDNAREGIKEGVEDKIWSDQHRVEMEGLTDELKKSSDETSFDVPNPCQSCPADEVKKLSDEPSSMPNLCQPCPADEEKQSDETCSAVLNPCLPCPAEEDKKQSDEPYSSVPNPLQPCPADVKKPSDEPSSSVINPCSPCPINNVKQNLTNDTSDKITGKHQSESGGEDQLITQLNLKLVFEATVPRIVQAK